MKRYGLVLLVVLIATASLLAAAAYSTAMVANASQVKIIATDDAHLALIPNPEFSDFCWVDSGGHLVVDFKGLHGFQPNSSYTFKNLFYVKNNLTQTNVEFGLRFDSCYVGDPSMPGLHTVYAGKSATGGGSSYVGALMHNNGGITNENWNSGRKVTLAPGEETGITFNFIVHNQQSLTTWARPLQVHSNAVGR